MFLLMLSDSDWAKPAYIDLSGEAGLDHVIELRALICACSRDTFVSVQAGEFPFGVPGDHVRVELLLIHIGRELLLAVRRDTAVCGDALLMVFLFIDED